MSVCHCSRCGDGYDTDFKPDELVDASVAPNVVTWMCLDCVTQLPAYRLAEIYQHKPYEALNALFDKIQFKLNSKR